MKNPDRIASFSVNHDFIEEGIYISRIDGDIVTYDLRTRKPNAGEYMDNITMHSVEHMIATYIRSGRIGGDVIYFGPMGCRTGFYLLLRDKVSQNDALKLVQEAFAFIAQFEGRIPGTDRIECGNYLEHDLEGAKAVAADMLEVLKDWSAEKMVYQA